MIADRHHRDDLAAVEEQGQRPFHNDSGFDRSSLVIDAVYGTGQPWVIRLRPDSEFLHKVMMGLCGFCSKRAPWPSRLPAHEHPAVLCPPTSRGASPVTPPPP